MIDPNIYYLVVRVEAAHSSGLTDADIRKRLCSGQTRGSHTDDFIPGQHTTIEDDGRVRWKVTRTDRKAPDGKKKMAFAVAAERYADEPNRVRKSSRRFLI